MSVPEARGYTAAEAVAGFMAAVALAISVIGVAHKPVRTIPIAIVVAAIAAGIGGRHRALAAFAVGAAGVAFVVGMTIAVATDRPLY